MQRIDTEKKRWPALGLAIGAGLLTAVGSAHAATAEQMEVAEKWLEEFQPSTLSKEEQLKELEWFIDAAEPFRGMDIQVVSETIATHVYESGTLAEAFSEITGINLTHDLISEGAVVTKIQTEMQTDRSVYDAYVLDSDHIGTLYRYGDAIAISDYMDGEGAEVTLPSLDIDDFIGISFVTAPNGKMYQLPDQQFANLYWFRYDWFQKPELRAQFEEIYGYELGVPVNWAAYEDIAEFFTEHVETIDGKRVYGHMDYGKKDPSLAWRFTDAWLSMAGAGDQGIPNGLPVDERGIRVNECHPVGSTMARGGATNSPAAVYAVEKYVEWLENYAPSSAAGMTFSESGPVPAQGHIAQQIFWYTAFTAPMTEEDAAVVNDQGLPKWRMAPSPHGVYWEEGMKLGYQDVGSWTLMEHTPPEQRKAAWLYAQFVTAKTTSLKKTLVGLTPIRESDINSQAMTEVAPKLGGLVEFYRSPARIQWSPTGTNVPDYPRLTPLWWQNISAAASGEVTPQQAMDNLAQEQDRVMMRLERADVQERCGPRMNEERDPSHWLSQPGAPKPELEDESAAPETIRYDELIKRWEQADDA